MITTIAEAAINFCTHQLTKKCQIADEGHSNKLFIASIEIRADAHLYTVYIAIENSLLQEICMLFLSEETSEQEVLIDMLLETTNMIVGSAKTILHTQNESGNFTISTPKFLNYRQFDYNCDQHICLTADSTYMLIALKEQK